MGVTFNPFYGNIDVEGYLYVYTSVPISKLCNNSFYKVVLSSKQGETCALRKGFCSYKDYYQNSLNQEEFFFVILNLNDIYKTLTTLNFQSNN